MLRCAVINLIDDWKKALPIKSDSLGTLKYKGDFPLDNWTIAWGIEWDSPLKGKNSGCFNDREFFNCIKGRGSFIREGGGFLVITENDGLRFEEAWNLRYEIRVDQHDGVNINGIKWTQNIKESDLKEVNLSGYNICALGDVSKFNKVEKLNIGFNLISKWEGDLRNGLSSMKLRWLNLSGNRFLEVIDDVSGGLEIETLILSRCMFRYTNNWETIVNWFINVKRLDLSFNELEDDDFETVSSLYSMKTIQCLEINGNGFTELRFNNIKWPKLRILQVSNSPIITLMIDLPLLTTLDISETKIGLTYDALKTWVSTVNVPNLSSIKLLTSECIETLDYTTNKLLLSSGEAPIDYNIILGLLSEKFPHLTKVNGTNYTNSQLEEYRGMYTRYTAVEKVETDDDNYTTIIVTVPIKGVSTRKSLRVKKGTPWYIIHGVLCRQFGLKAGDFILDEITT